jgi:1-acyl-sn-glycerol-3-phosphate acyltransferase
MALQGSGGLERAAERAGAGAREGRETGAAHPPVDDPQGAPDLAAPTVEQVLAATRAATAPAPAPVGPGPALPVSPSPREAPLLDAIVRFAERQYGEDLERRLKALQLRVNDCGVDPFGFDPDTARHTLALLLFLHRTYFRTEVFGLEHTPPGAAIYVGNHGGHVPIDGMLIASSLFLDRDPPVLVRSMVEKWAQTVPFVARWFPRIGQVLGSPDNARRLLQDQNPLLVFPEGVRGISKPFADRYQLAPFGLGFMRLALENRVPVVPIAVIGAEEQFPAVANLKGLARLLGTPSFPVIPQLLLGFPLPLPTRYRIYFGEPLWFEGDPDDDDHVIQRHVDEVRGTVQRMLRRGLAERTSIFW